jgi:hypothetical protein
MCSPTLRSLSNVFGVDIGFCRNADIVIVKALMSTLTTAVESYIGLNICFSALILEDAKSYEIKVAQEALQALSLWQVFPTVRAAASVVDTQTLSTFCGLHDEPCVVLVVEHSSYWFNVGLCTIDEIGTVSLIDSTVRRLTIGEVDQLNALEDTLRARFTNSPADVVLPHQIHHIVVYGDTAKDDVLNLLETLLGADLIHDTYKSNSVFDGVPYTAKFVHELMDTVEFEKRVQGSFDCEWRSKLHNEDHTEL